MILKIIFGIISVVIYLGCVVFNYNKYVNNLDPMNTSYFESKYPFISSISPLGHPFILIILYCLFAWLALS